MKLGNYKAVIHHGQALCVECVPPETNPDEIEPIFANDEMDSYPLCAVCCELHDYMRISLKQWEVQNEEAFNAIGWD